MGFNDIGVAGYTPPGLAYNVGKSVLGNFGGLFGGGGDSGPNIDINAEMERINALYATARTEGTNAITQDFQQQRGELAQSQAARGILRSGVSQLGLAKLGAGRQMALSQFNSQLAAAQAGQQSNLLNALLGRKTALDTAAADRKRAGQSQLLGIGAGLLGSYLAGPIGGVAASQLAGKATSGGGFNFFGSNMVAPQAATPQNFYQNEFGGSSGFGGAGYSASPTNWSGQGFR